MRTTRTHPDGLLIALEGLDGAGTTTQAGLLADWLRSQDIDVVATAEPTTGPLGAIARQAMEGRIAIDSHALALAFAADRMDHLCRPNGIRDALLKGKWVVCDRYLASSLAYQSANGLPYEWLLGINAHADSPDVTVFIDTPVPESIRRISQRGLPADAYEDEGTLARVRRRYFRVVQDREIVGNLAVVDGSQSRDVVFEAVRDGISGVLDAWRHQPTREPSNDARKPPRTDAIARAAEF